MATMFEKYGGFGSVSRVVSAFYDKAINSPVIGKYFVGIDMRTLIDHQTKFVASLMGGPASFTNEQLRRAHQNLDIDEAAFAEMAMLFKETLEDFDFEQADIYAVEDEIMSRKRYIVGAQG